MAKICGQCGHRTNERDPGWCPGCGLSTAWFDDVGDTAVVAGSSGGRLVRADALDATELPRIKTGTPFDTVLGGGVPRGACILLWGRGGSGKTRLAAQLCDKLHPSVFVSIEMPEEMTANYLQKLGVHMDRVWVTPERDWRSVALRARPRLVVLDSVSEFGTGAAAEMAAAYEWAHRHHVTVIAICHANRDGSSKGGSVLSHKCDAALVVRQRGRGRVTLVGPEKNRFAATGALAPVANCSIV